MIECKYCELSVPQIESIKKWIRGQIYFLLVNIDPDTSKNDVDINIREAYEGLLLKLGGMNKLLGYPPELITIMSLLESSLIELETLDLENFRSSKVRKCLLEAGNEVLKINGGL